MHEQSSRRYDLNWLRTIAIWLYHAIFIWAKKSSKVKIVRTMLDSEKLDYCQWCIPGGSRVCLALLQLEDLDIIHRWKSQIDISYITSKAIQHPSLADRQRRFQEGLPPV
jgi:hypothetical protein